MARKLSSPRHCFIASLLLGAQSCSAIRFAVCLTGQLPRLELGTKVQNVMVNNLAAGFDISLFVRLSNESATSGALNLSSNLYTSLSEQQLQDFISRQVSHGMLKSGSDTAGVFHVSVVYDTTTHPTYFEPFRYMLKPMFRAYQQTTSESKTQPSTVCEEHGELNVSRTGSRATSAGVSSVLSSFSSLSGSSENSAAQSSTMNSKTAAHNSALCVGKPVSS